MNFYQELLNQLKATFLEDSRLKQLNLGHPDTWTQQNFITVSNLMASHISKTQLIDDHEKNLIGPTISVSTLKRIFKYDYSIDHTLDKRQIKSLDKICLFLNIKGWQEYHLNYLKGIKNSDHEELINTLNKALEIEFNCYKAIPNENKNLLDKYYLAGSPAIKKIQSTISKKKSQNLHLSNHMNPSSFELIDAQIESIKEDEVHITTKEYWYLAWYNSKSGNYDYIYNELNKQFYLMEKRGEDWKIKVNFYSSPNPGD